MALTQLGIRFTTSAPVYLRTASEAARMLLPVVSRALTAKRMCPRHHNMVSSSHLCVVGVDVRLEFDKNYAGY